MRRHRQRAAQRHANELRRLETNGSMRQVTVQRWLDEQSTSDNLERFAGESCPICLTSLLVPSALSPSDSTVHPHLNQNQNQPPSPPEAAHISHHHPNPLCRPQTNNDDYDGCTRPLRAPTPHDYQGGRSNTQCSFSGVLILNRCNHAFHTACLASWLQYRQYRCPICADVLFPG
ncbi:RING finger protein [Aspergillus puulaauensis]|uniref:RING-type domain-containing protein n=1 Tax=Aspergillus puulaauensis TaxID=1220207 RepID=A0A7R7XAD2_9EURO|nr:uncharacterized protein APUU_10610S [Aspergillus puulaauensis]BCS17782.1 hypothetical protein APUU_10610S [Aspergillus puulaauensis]